jgi:hypothetical protein
VTVQGARKKKKNGARRTVHGKNVWKDSNSSDRIYRIEWIVDVGFAALWKKTKSSTNTSKRMKLSAAQISDG